ncbi:hypothetical protein [Curtobacterium ammoniigenes]|uniref:hypothetical protein n=1 Tax=Curtobacterium ammoniigenes TaxID=395387 RepID=UPI00082F3D0F|nr:hypothetical protein [Curtobacterium ammoniigenes]
MVTALDGVAGIIEPSTWVTMFVVVVVGGVLAIAAPPVRRTATDPLVAWRRSRLHGLGIGVVIGALFGGAFVMLTGADRGSAVPGLVLLPAAVGALAGSSVPGVRASLRRSVRSSRRVAHVIAPARPDGGLTWSARAAVAVASVAVAVQFAIVAHASDRASTAVYPAVAAFITVPALVMLILSEIETRVLRGTPTSAGSAEHLRFQDRQRAQAHRDAAGGALGLGVLACLIAVPTTVSALAPHSLLLVLAAPAVQASIEIIAAAWIGAVAAASFSERAAARTWSVPDARDGAS